jgi:hypothetical protein
MASWVSPEVATDRLGTLRAARKCRKAGKYLSNIAASDSRFRLGMRRRRKKTAEEGSTRMSQPCNPAA